MSIIVTNYFNNSFILFKVYLYVQERKQSISIKIINIIKLSNKVLLNFFTEENVNKMKAVVHGVILGVEVPFDLPNPDACLDSGLTCPLKNGGTYTYSTTLPVLKVYPRVRLRLFYHFKISYFYYLF